MGCEPTELPASILKRLLVRFNYDDNYYANPTKAFLKMGTRAMDDLTNQPTAYPDHINRHQTWLQHDQHSHKHNDTDQWYHIITQKKHTRENKWEYDHHTWSTQTLTTPTPHHQQIPIFPEILIWRTIHIIWHCISINALTQTPRIHQFKS